MHLHPDYLAISDRVESCMLEGRFELALRLRREGLAYTSIYFDEDSPEHLHALHGLASALIDHGAYDEAESHLNTALSISQNHPNSIEALLMQSEIRLHQNQNQSALQLLKQAEVLLREFHFLLGEALTMLQVEWCRNMAWYHENLEQFDHAEAEYQKALYLAKTIHDGEALLLPIISELGLCASKQEKHELALQYFQESLDLAKQLYQNPHPEIANAHYDLAQAYLNLHQLDNAHEHAQSALHIDQQFFDANHMMLARDYALHGEIDLERDELEHAEDWLNRSLEIVRHCHPDGCLEMAQVYELLSEIYEETDRTYEAEQLRRQADELYQRFDHQP